MELVRIIDPNGILEVQSDKFLAFHEITPLKSHVDPRNRVLQAQLGVL